MKTLKITLLAIVFGVTLTGLKSNNDDFSEKDKASKTTKVDYNFAVKRHVKKGQTVPTQG
ncbi:MULTISPECIES: hypothetical protein [Corallibacter]|uniref:Uncharacterized protein n=1 Tax=Corallibacter vietnamensis TaxID=904130 RepID=A0ABP7GWT5_9FLAO